MMPNSNIGPSSIKEMKPSDVNTHDVDEGGKSSKILSENMSKLHLGSKDEKAAQIVEANPLAKDDTSVGTKSRGHKYSKVHKFWETQPVMQFKDIGDKSLPEGPIEPATALSKVKQEPYNLPSLFEWTTCDMNSDDMCLELVDVEFTTLRKMTMSMANKLYKLPDAPITPGFRKMEPRDVPAVTGLLRNYLSQFGVATDFDEDDVGHWLLPREDVVHSYVVESPQTHEVTDLCSFYALPLTVLGNSKYTTVECAYSYYNVATQTSFPQLMNDALIVSKQKGFDVFFALDVMHNESFLKELRFDPGDEQMYYYFYNYRLRGALKPSEFGLVL
ncbi:unnamed protein product [Thlaspi arvense]|uniref:Glycylpeptide N-tetradecanoyltransferase n=1 Tax=Thlaspi arvense TaxID=13288 RepID=A0AAU9S417_THLAR|nr:unnamed protein product [Thlaspi arvense]